MLAAVVLAGALLGACSSGQVNTSGDPPESAMPAADDVTPTEEGTTLQDDSAQPEALSALRIALSEVNSAFVNLLIAKHGGFFEANGLDVELVVLASPTIASALVAGDVDLTADAGSATRAALAGLPVTVVAATMAGSDYTITADE